MTGNKIIQEDLQQIVTGNVDWKQFSGKTILITGASGFLPAYMVETLLYLCHEGIVKNLKVIALVRNLEKAKKRFQYNLNDKNLEIIVQDVCKPVDVGQNIDFIVHAASQASPKFYGTDPVGTLEPNIIGTTNLMRLAKMKKTQGFLFFSSSEVYGSTGNTNAIRESDSGFIDPLNIRSCYAESKRMGETICSSWYHQYNVPVKIVRVFHTYGPGISLDDGRVFADLISDVVKGKDLVLNSDGSALRTYCYLSDAILGYFYILLHGKCGEAYNVGNPYQEYSVKDLAGTLISLFPEKSLKIIIDPATLAPGYHPSGVSRIFPDISKVQELGWSPKIDVRSGFRRTILSYY